MFHALKEIIWHITCPQCKFYFTYPTMENKYDPENGKWICPKCGHKDHAKIIDGV